MKLFPLLLCSLVLLATHAAAQQEPPEDPRAGELVDCGEEKVAILGRTVSKDGRFALGWTLLPTGKQAPVDWAAYDRKQPTAIMEKLSISAEEGEKGDYKVVDGLLDLQAKTFTPLASKFPYFPGKNRGDFSTLWSEERQGFRYAVVGIDARLCTLNLWLIEIGSGGPHVTDLGPAADKAVGDLMRKRDPKDHDRYGIFYQFGTTSRGDKGKPVAGFKNGTLKIRFSAEIPKGEDSDSGNITFALPKGNVTNVAADRKK